MLNRLLLLFLVPAVLCAIAALWLWMQERRQERRELLERLRKEQNVERRV